MATITLHRHNFGESHKSVHDQVTAVIKAGQRYATKYGVELALQENIDYVDLLIPLHQAQICAIKGSTSAINALATL